MDYFMNNRVAGPQGNRHPHMAPHNLYPCRGDDAWVSIAVESDEEWEALRRALGDPKWASDQRFDDAHSRWAHQEQLDHFLAHWTQERTPQEATEHLQQAGVAALPCLKVSEVADHPLHR